MVSTLAALLLLLLPFFLAMLFVGQQQQTLCPIRPEHEAGPEGNAATGEWNTCMDAEVGLFSNDEEVFVVIRPGF